VVTTPSQLAFETVRKLVSLLGDLKIQVVGIVENMKMSPNNAVQQQTLKLGLNFLGEIPFDPKVEEAIGDPDKLLETVFAEKVQRMITKIEHVPPKATKRLN
jgi:ATP-binding protein involved in chromosome partitioning